MDHRITRTFGAIALENTTTTKATQLTAALPLLNGEIMISSFFYVDPPPSFNTI
jgi:hypothetical protein